jgi:hypothetical protein
MRTVQPDAVRGRRCWCLLFLLLLSSCSTAYHFRYRYTLIAPPGGAEGVEDERVRIQLSPAPESGVMQLTVMNKNDYSITVVWEQTHYIDPLGRRQPATETGMQWFFRPREWFVDETRIAPGDTLRTRVQPGEHQTYNPFTVSRSASGGIALSSAPRPLLPTSGNTRTVGQAYEGREFQFVLALRLGTDVTRYPFTFRVTDVEVQ